MSESSTLYRIGDEVSNLNHIEVTRVYVTPAHAATSEGKDMWVPSDAMDWITIAVEGDLDGES